MDNVKNWHAIYREIAVIFGDEVARNMHVHYGGAQVTFPMQLLSRQGRIRAIKFDAAQGLTVTALSRKYHVSQRTIKHYLQL